MWHRRLCAKGGVRSVKGVRVVPGVFTLLIWIGDRMGTGSRQDCTFILIWRSRMLSAGTRPILFVSRNLICTALFSFSEPNKNGKALNRSAKNPSYRTLSKVEQPQVSQEIWLTVSFSCRSAQPLLAQKVQLIYDFSSLAAEHVPLLHCF